MKQLSTFWYGSKLIAALLILTFFSCSENDISFNSDENMLTLDNQEQFDDLVNFVMTADSAEIADYTSSLDFKSLKVIMQEVEAAEEALLAELEAKYDPDIPREREYAAITKQYLEKGVLRLDEFGIPELNIPIPAFALFLNEEREVKIGDQTYQFDYDNIRIIEPESRTELAVNPVERISHEGGKAGLENGKSCTSTSGKYRLITYENNLIWSTGNGVPCGDSKFSHWLLLRSLKKVFGSWHNHKTSALKIRGSVRIAHYQILYPSGELKFIRYMTFENNYFYNLPYDHTEDHYFVRDYPLKYGINNECISYQIKFDYTYHTGIGKNGTGCSL
ncbi:hypothetical protein C900_02323 [Fulvivirga imtechensis AK7]|uniref:Uncharacterized protein n=1 Tax=Fulvivirga imtechensis AK7 TaxID=1237149 RepID=L8JU22_9BACT|nr:hypothetical protein [Fulvivirga imtechensis]ELR71738.1 hypothetical protein C900_02323 [Fulvivirga imtechensis AK7]